MVSGNVSKAMENTIIKTESLVSATTTYDDNLNPTKYGEAYYCYGFSRFVQSKIY